MEITDYGICRLALIPVRKVPGHSAEQTTQLLFGESYQVIEGDFAKGEFLKISLNDGTEGWINSGHHHAIAADYYDQIHHADFKITTDITASLLYKKSALTILMGSIVPISTSELFKMEEQLAFNGESKSLSQKRDPEFIKMIALKYVNSPWQQGGRSPFGIDAAGLLQMVFKICGYTLPRDIDRQSVAGKKISEAGETKCGDIAFFSTGNADDDREVVSHAGIVLDDDKILHASGRVRVDHLNEEGILNIESRIYTHHLIGIRRIVGE